MSSLCKVKDCCSLSLYKDDRFGIGVPAPLRKRVVEKVFLSLSSFTSQNNSPIGYTYSPCIETCFLISFRSYE